MCSASSSSSSISGISSDVRESSLSLTVVTKHPAALNCCDSEGRRWSLIKNEEDLQPRSILFEFLPQVAVSEVLNFDMQGVSVVFDVSLRRGIRFNSRWAPLAREWSDFGDEPDLRSLSEECKRAELCELSGFGPGLTPAGDDFITGWITANMSIDGDRAKTLREFFCERWNPEGTTWFSRWMIRDALCGSIWKRGKELLHALEGSSASTLTEALSSILNWGHTSGVAWLAGLGRGFEDLEVI